MIFHRIAAWLKGGRLVYLKDFDGEITVRIATTNPWGELTASRLPVMGSRVTLNPDGTTSGARYVKNWKYVPDFDWWHPWR